MLVPAAFLTANLSSTTRRQAGCGNSGCGHSDCVVNSKNTVVDMPSPHYYLLTLCLSFALLTSGCVIVPDQRHYAGGVVMVAPPAPREELVGVAPEPGDVWLSGYWSWVGDRHAWVPGHWAPPRPGRHWVPHQWVRQGDGWRLRPGHWERR